MPPRFSRMGSSSYSAFGVALVSDFVLWPQAAAPLCTRPALAVVMGRFDAVASLSSRDPKLMWQTVIDGCTYEMHRGSAGDHCFSWGTRAVFHLTADADTLTCGFAEPEDPAARRVLLDTVLWSVSLLRGNELLHGGAVSYDGSAIAIVAPSGTGKTSLVAELIRRGAQLLTDDMLALSSVDGQPVAHPGPPLMNLPLAQLPAHTELGAVLACLGDEAWITVDSQVVEPQPLRAVCVLERNPTAPTVLERHPRAALALIPHALAFPGESARRGRQLELLGDLSAATPVLRLSAGENAPPPVLAELIERDLMVAPVAAGAAR